MINEWFLTMTNSLIGGLETQRLIIQHYLRIVGTVSPPLCIAFLVPFTAFAERDAFSAKYIKCASNGQVNFTVAQSLHQF